MFDLKDELNPIDSPCLLIEFDRGHIMDGTLHFLQKIIGHFRKESMMDCISIELENKSDVTV